MRCYRSMLWVRLAPWCLVASVAYGGTAWAWGATGHEMVSGIAAELLPDTLPAFLRTPEVAAEIAVLGRELDRSKGAGKTHDAERDPGHYVDLDDDGAVFGVAPLTRLPPTREEYDTLLRQGGYTQYKAGYLPYSIVDGWQQLRKDFAYWRADVIGARTAVDPAERAWFETDRIRREKLIIRDLGVWSHYIGDASQPMHISIHFTGWGPHPNPKGYSTSTSLHAFFEGQFVRQFVDRAAVVAAVRPYRDCACSIEDRTRTYLLETRAQIEPLYQLELAGAFKNATPEGRAFAAQRLAAGASELRDMIVDAWNASVDATVGYPERRVRDIEAGTVVLTRAMFGAD